VPYVAQMHNIETSVNAVSHGRFKFCYSLVHCIFGPSQAQSEGSVPPWESVRIWKRQRYSSGLSISWHWLLTPQQITSSMLASTKECYYRRKPALIFTLHDKMDSRYKPDKENLLFTL